MSGGRILMADQLLDKRSVAFDVGIERAKGGLGRPVPCSRNEEKLNEYNILSCKYYLEY